MSGPANKWRPEVPWLLLIAALGACAAGFALEFGAAPAELFWLARGAFAGVGAGAVLIVTGLAWLMRIVLARREPDVVDESDAGDHA